MSNLSSSWLPFLIRHDGISSWDLRSDTGKSVLGNKLGDVRNLSFLLRIPPGPPTVEDLSPSRARVGGDRRCRTSLKAFPVEIGGVRNDCSRCRSSCCCFNRVERAVDGGVGSGFTSMASIL